MHRLFTGPLTVDCLTVPIRQLPAAQVGTVIVQLSDFHYDGRRLSDWLLTAAIATVQQIQPDLIALTGDFVTDNPAPIEALANHLKHLPSRHGAYAVLGNHDLYPPGARATITTALEKAGIAVLWNQIAYPLGPDLPLVGLADLRSRAFQPGLVLDHLDPAQPRLVLSHNPDTAALLQPWRVDLQLSGHTHGGQIVIPGLGPLPRRIDQLRRRLPRRWRRGYLSDRCAKVVRHWEWSQGLHQVGDNQLYVNRGLGTYLPGRLWCPPEVTVIRLITAEYR